MIKWEIFTLDIPIYYIVLITIIGLWCVNIFIGDVIRNFKKENYFMNVWRLYNVGIALYMILSIFGVRRI